MPRICLFVLALPLLPVLVHAKSQNEPCGLAYEMQQAELPQDIAIRVDSMTSAVTGIAMNWWAARLSTPARPTTWHIVEKPADCMMYIRHGWDNMMSRRSAAGYTHMPDHQKYDGVATVKLLDAWVVAHEIGHLIGCRHGSGVMHADYVAGKELLWIDDDALHFALLVRIKASTGAHQQYSSTRTIKRNGAGRGA
jgi:hypothetical protein